MAIGVLINIPACTQEQYDTVIRRLEEVGAGAPAGRLYHVAGPANGDWRVVDVWESIDAFQAFAATLVPITQAAGVQPFQPDVFPAHNILTR